MDKKNLLILGGTGSLGKSLIKHFIDDYNIFVFSRDEAKHVIVKQLYSTVKSFIGDIRDRDAVLNAIYRSNPDVIINASALKNVPEVEEVPMEGIKTSLIGTDNLNYAAMYYSLSHNRPIKVLTVSTDKACKPVNSYGMAKALQERLHIRSNSAQVICNAVRYGNVLESRGSLIPILKQRLSNNQAVYVTHPDMTRFFLTLDDSVELIKRALADNEGGKIFIPIIQSARILDLVKLFVKLYNCNENLIQFSSIRPGEKIHEILVSVEEAIRTEQAGNVQIIHDILSDKQFSHVHNEVSSGSAELLLEGEALYQFLFDNGVISGL